MQSKAFSRMKLIRMGLLLATLSWAMPGQAVIINLAADGFGINVDGALSCAGLGCSQDDSGFDYVSGLGTLDFSITGAGHHTVVLFVDHEIDEATNTFYNEYGAATGAAAAGQTWEIDEPEYVFGDIFSHFLDSGFVAPVSFLDETNAVPQGLEEDVSMALGWDFDLLDGEIADISFLLSSLAAPSSGFYLSQTDPESTPDAAAPDATIYFSSLLSIRSVAVPEPATGALLGLGLLAIGLVRRRRA